MMRDRTKSVKPLTSAELDEEGVDPLFMVWLAARSTQDLLDSVLSPAGLSGEEFAIYSMLAAAPGITPGELSRWMAAPRTSVSSYVKRLESRGHLTRATHPSDRRSYRIHLTGAGRTAHQSAVTLFAPVRSRVIESLGEHEARVRESLLLIRMVVDGLRGDLGSAGGS